MTRPVTALIVAAGQGSRMGGETPKQYRSLAGKAVLAHAVDVLASHPLVEAVRVVIGAGQEVMARDALGDRDVGDFIVGGATRSQSVRNGLAAVSAEHVMIHDAARPFCPSHVVDALVAALDEAAGATPALVSVDTLARRHGETLGGTVDRSEIVRIQTPQAFRADVLRRAYDAWTGEEPTDEAQVVRAFGGEVTLVEGDRMLDKLTSAEDFAAAQQRLAATMIPRTGMGFDVHGFAGDGPVMLGGVAVPHEKGLSGHSDADVLLHAITDALLGAAALGDIGQHFPPSDPKWKGADSETFLAHAASLVRNKGGMVDHVDATLICEAPKVGPHREAMQANIARILGLSAGEVSVKATTTEKLGFTGRREGIACQAVANVRMPA
ncbi:bifunctional 2-C-methyl-D-erythritol 4-phosphate cytidylyltransferase/2-C-methyl-D-erythritol 2,4-cyclodiphosphate synthase [Sphingomicrobium nitratireducens]|uniref:bifunctional 2-C-methyl-D-erythritol 4-phosphate cytidylyltransferase/2-C-methyl-D-erythritol 2,4-cyclodiphosphate synthase n=1 Tax=Sphingomicrobium nitratireducens TaxID=2964666 RepID=UPI00223E8EFF|nr:bifunctional 2-C-methyl-D-erythritol 4-phosphate cytidylyltransferase/2-C-methyl-D-erythritol 2,4-cyclodiphosphate synthase [Sphingomicrobium nitratireducens]